MKTFTRSTAPSASQYIGDFLVTDEGIGGTAYRSNGVSIERLLVDAAFDQLGRFVGVIDVNGDEQSIGFFTGSIYSGAKTTTTTVTGQSELFPTGSEKLQFSHASTTFDLIIGLGNTVAEAELACSTGVAGDNKHLLLRTGSVDLPASALIPRKGYLARAWLGVGGTVTAMLTDGV